jgi:N-terminal acetyltransferase 2
MRGARLWSYYDLFPRALSRTSIGRQPAPILRNFFTSAQALSRLRTQPLSVSHGTSTVCSKRSLLSYRFRSLRFKSDNALPSKKPDPTSQLGSPEPELSLSQRMKKLSREYGWSAFGVYMALTALDFPFCFLAVRLLGTDRIAHYEHVVVEAIMNVIRIPFPNLGKKKEAVEAAEAAEATATEGLGDIEEAEAANNGEGACTKYASRLLGSMLT